MACGQDACSACAGSGLLQSGAGLDALPVRECSAGSRKPEAGSRKPEAGSRKPEAGSRKPEAGSRKPEAGSRKPEAGSRVRGVPGRLSERLGAVAGSGLPWERF
ncbi:hypothetical protein ACFPN7_20855 [Amycolatopsis halotolerans]|uniref:hypothetical protein n=1 Tax=Amycolatopsis halotolerans TaxID=330083 RepID=UPI003611078B